MGALGCPDGPWFNEVAEFLGTAYLRNAFTKGTEQEVDFLVEAARARAGDAGARRRVRAGAALARAGSARHHDRTASTCRPTSSRSPSRPPSGEALPATFEVLDVRDLAFDGEYDAVDLPLPGRVRAARRR